MSRRRPKRISSQQITGQQGVNLVERAVLAMGFGWHPTNQALEVGIDGIIEIRDPETGEATNSIIQVQVKATKRKWIQETSEEFVYHCRPQDVEYWLKGNAPVILVAVRPEGNEAYWANVKNAFADDRRQNDCCIRFNKATDRFDESAAGPLLRMAVPRDVGPYLPAPTKREQLISNLLRVKSLPPKIHVASTNYRTPSEIFAWAKEDEISLPSGWYLGDGLIYAFHDLREGACSGLCDSGSVETFDVDEWSDSNDTDKQRQFVRLLNQAFRGDMRLRRLWRSKDEKCYYFPARWADDGPTSRTYSYRSLQQNTSSEVVKVQLNKDGDGIWYCRHDAFQHAFLRIQGEWNLAITPHYVFTNDGKTPHPNSEELLSGLKKQERQKAILGQALMWRHKLTTRSRQMHFGQSSTEQPLIDFDSLLQFQSQHGINDADWLSGDPMTDNGSAADPVDGGLFA